MTQVNRWFWLVALLIVAVFLYLLAPILLPFIMGALLAYLGDPLVDRLEKWKISKKYIPFLIACINILKRALKSSKNLLIRLKRSIRQNLIKKLIITVHSGMIMFS